MRERWLTGVLVILVMLLTVGVVGWLTGSGSAAPARVVQWSGVAAPLPPEHAAQKARERATAWRPDAVLVRVEASWRPDERWLEARSLPVTWLFTYYSPSEDALATVAVNAEKLLWMPPMEAIQPPRALPTFPPPYSASQMWLTFLGAGGGEVVRQHPGSLVHISLQMEDEGPVWRVSVVGEGGLWTVRIHAETGTVIP